MTSQSILPRLLTKVAADDHATLISNSCPNEQEFQACRTVRRVLCSSSPSREVTVKVSIVQMNTQDDKSANLKSAKALIEKAVAEEKPDLVVLPEYYAF